MALTSLFSVMITFEDNVWTAKRIKLENSVHKTPKKQIGPMMVFFYFKHVFEFELLKTGLFYQDTLNIKRSWFYRQF